MDRRDGNAGRNRSRDNETFGGAEAESPWHQADHPSAADFESERQKRHSVTESIPKPAPVSIEAAPDNGAQGQGAGGDFDAGAYAFFGDPSGSGLELELGGLDDDGGGLLTAGDDSTVKALEAEDEVDPEELRDEEEDKQAREAFAKLTTSETPPASTPWELNPVNLTSTAAPAAPAAPAQPAWWPKAESPVPPTSAPQESWDWHLRQLQAQQAQQRLQQQQGPPAGALSLEQLEASLRQGAAPLPYSQDRGQGYPGMSSGGPANRGPPGFNTASRPAPYPPQGPPLPHFDVGRPQYRAPPPGALYGSQWAQPPSAHLSEQQPHRSHSPQPLPPNWGEGLSSQALLHLHALQQQASAPPLPPSYAHEQGLSGGGPYYGGASQLRPQRSGGDGQSHYNGMQGGQPERRPTPMPQPGQGYGGQQGYLGRPNYRSKYMSQEEVEAIVRMQWNATHPQDPYVDDYYHQAAQAKAENGTPHGRRHFAPSHLREGKATAEPHAFLQVEGLGRIPFSSIRRPRPLLEVSGPAPSKEVSRDGHTPPPPRPLEQEPMLAARIAIEDGMCLLLDVDDINRLLAVSQPPDGGMQLRRRKQILLEGLAASLQLSDSADHGGGRELSDLVFLRLVSLPKGRKLIARYLQLLPRGSDLSRTVVLAIMRHLRFLFGGAHADPGTATSLAGSVAAAISSLDLAALSACLATALGAVEYPPLRPLRSVNGDGATVVLLAVLDRASVVLSGQEGGPPPSAMAQEIWQSNFDSFFGLLAKHCSAKFEAIAAAAEAGGGMNAAAAAAIGAEVPVELLRSSLPHTNDNQRAFLLDTIRKTVAAGGFAHGGRDMQPNTATVHG